MSERSDMLAHAVAELDEPSVRRLVGEMLTHADERRAVFSAIQTGTEEAVRRYREGKYFIADLIMAGALYSDAVERAVSLGERMPARGRVICGVVRRDIHELGKNIIAGLLEYNGYEVTDLGVDVEPELFADAVRELRPDTLILSGVLDLSLVQMERTISALEERGLRGGVRVLLGGSCVTREQSEAIGADGYIADLLDCLRLCESGAAV